MNILKAYQKLKSAADFQIVKYGANREVFLCNITRNLLDDDKITEKEHDKIIDDIESHIKCVSRENGTMYSCLDKVGCKLSYDEISVYANEYRMAWLDLQIIKYRLTNK